MTCPVHNWPLKDASGCWQCYDERRIAGKPAKVKKVYQLPKVSPKKAHREKELAKVRQERKQVVKYCETCGVTGQPLSYSHILSVKQFPQYESHPDNALLECLDCHHTYEHGSLADKMKQKSWPQKLRFILENEPAYFNKLQLKNL